MPSKDLASETLNSFTARAYRTNFKILNTTRAKLPNLAISQSKYPGGVNYRVSDTTVKYTLWGNE